MSGLVGERAAPRPVASGAALPIVSLLLVAFAGCLAAATAIALALGFDLLVPPPVIPETLDLPSRLVAIQPFREARWPFDAASRLLFVVGFAALALAADPIATLAGATRRAPVIRGSILATGLLGAAGGLLYVGATQIAITSTTCDCGFTTEEVISRFWAHVMVIGATDWLGYGATAFGALGLALSATALRAATLPRAFTWTALAASAALATGVVVRVLGDPNVGDLVIAVATGLLLPAWALMLAAAVRRAEAHEESAA